MKAHFGHIAYYVTFTDEPIPISEEDGGGEAVGMSHHRERRIEVLKGGEVAPEYAANTLLHEILHAACSAVGFHPDNEEEIASALAAGLTLFLQDARNAEVLAEIVPAPRIVLGMDPGKTDREEVMHQRMWQVPDEGPKFGRLKQHDLTDYIDAMQRTVKEMTDQSPVVGQDKVIDEQVRSDFAGLAAAAAEGAETVAPPADELELGSGRFVCGHRYIEDGEREICKKAPVHRGIHGPKEEE